MSLANVHVSSWRTAYRGIVPQTYLDQLSVADRHARWVKIFEQGDSEALLAETSGTVIGFVSYGKSRDEDADHKTGEIYAIYVDPEHWSKGTGYSLWIQSRLRLKTLGFTHASIWVLSENTRAIEFYKRVGFELCAGSETMIEIGGKELEEVKFGIAIVE